MPRGRTAIPITQPTKDRKKTQELDMPKTTPEQNKTIVLKALDTLFNKRDYAAVERSTTPPITERRTDLWCHISAEYLPTTAKSER